MLSALFILISFHPFAANYLLQHLNNKKNQSYIFSCSYHFQYFKFHCVDLYFDLLLFSFCVRTLIFPKVQMFWWWVILAFICLETSLLDLTFTRFCFLLSIEFYLNSCFFQYFEDVPLLSSYLHCFHWEFCFCLCSSVCNMSFLQSLFTIFLLNIGLSNLITICLGIVFFMFLVHGVH